MSQASQVNSTGNSAAVLTRRSTRIEKSIPIIVLGQNRMGEPFMERTVSICVNKHGCRYPSRHDYGVGTMVTLQMVGLNGGNEKPQTVRAMVKSIHPSANLRELQQVGVELVTPSNVWGIMPAPADWTSTVEPNMPTSQLSDAVAPARKSETKKAEFGEALQTAEPKLAEVASFPSPSAAPGTAQPSEPPAAQVAGTSQVQRVVMTPEKLIAALQGKFQHEAEKAVQAALAKQVDERVQEALRSMEDARRSSVQEVRQFVSQWKTEMNTFRAQGEEMAQRLEKQAGELRRELASTAQEQVEKMTREIAPQIPARLNEVVSRATSDFESATAVIVDRRYERLIENVQTVTQEALLNLNARSVEVQALAQSAMNVGLEEFRREAERHVRVALTETKERAVSALSSLDAESRAACDARRQALEAEVSRSADRVTDEFRKGMKAFLYSCLVAAVSAADEHSRATLDGLVQGSGEILEETRERTANGTESEIVPDVSGGLLPH